MSKIMRFVQIGLTPAEYQGREHPNKQLWVRPRAICWDDPCVCGFAVKRKYVKLTPPYSCDRLAVNGAKPRMRISHARLTNMIRVLKTLLLWVLIALMPLQGFAAVLQHLCHGSHMSNADAAIATVDQKSSMMTDMASMPAEAHAHCIGHSGKFGKKSSDHHPAKHDSCSGCSGCSVGTVAPPIVFPVVLIPELLQVRLAFMSTPVSGHIPDRLERPPR